MPFKYGLDSSDFQSAAKAMLAKTPAAAAAASQAVALSFIAAAKRNATGAARPGGWAKGKKSVKAGSRSGGPGVVTGFLRNSIAAQQSVPLAGRGWITTVYPAGPYYRRIELGFTGRDSLGRSYKQPPYRFMGPARDTTAVVANQIAAQAFGTVFGW